MKWAAAMLLVASLGCRKPEDKAAEALRKETEILLERTKTLTLTRWDPIDDGGSHVFRFKTDFGAGLHLLMLHDRPNKGGNPKYQEFRVCSLSSSAECDVARGSTLERRLIELLSDCRLDPGTGPWKPVPDTIPWLHRRMMDRTIPFDSPPHTR